MNILVILQNYEINLGYHIHFPKFEIRETCKVL